MPDFESMSSPVPKWARFTESPPQRDRASDKLHMLKSVQCENLDDIDRLIHYYGGSHLPIDDALYYSCRCGKIKVLDYLRHRIEGHKHLPTMVIEAVRWGHLPVLEWIYRWLEQKTSKDAASGIRPLPQYRLQFYERFFRKIALEDNHLHILNWMVAQKIFQAWKADDFLDARSQQVMQWLTEQGADIRQCTVADITAIVKKALRENRLGTLRWLQRQHVYIGAYGDLYCFLYAQLLAALQDRLGPDLMGLVNQYIP